LRWTFRSVASCGRTANPAVFVAVGCPRPGGAGAAAGLIRPRRASRNVPERTIRAAKVAGSVSSVRDGTALRNPSSARWRGICAVVDRGDGPVGRGAGAVVGIREGDVLSGLGLAATSGVSASASDLCRGKLARKAADTTEAGWVNGKAFRATTESVG